MAKRPQDPLKIDREHLLLCEGKATLLVLGPMMRKLAIRGFQPLNFEEKDDLEDFLADLVLLPGFRKVKGIAIVRDAEDAAAGALASVQGALRKHNLPVPSLAGTAGVCSGPPQIGVFLMPDNSSQGMLEMLCMNSVADDPAFACVEEFFRCVQQNMPKPPRNLQIHKARAQTFLATREVVEYHVGRAADSGAWNFEHAAFAPLAAFLRALVPPEAEV